MKFIKNLLPGFMVCVLISLSAQFLAQFVPQIGSALIAILLGILLGNTLLKQRSLELGTKFSESKLLEIAIALTGLTISLQALSAVGIKGLFYIVLQMLVTIIGVFYLGKVFKMGKKFRLLMAAGNAVCGSSAIATVAPVVEAKEKEKGLSITVVNLTGTVLMILLPFVTSFLYQHEVVQTSAMIGGNLQSVGQVVAAAKMVSDPVTELATIFKIVRIVLLVAVVLMFSKLNTAEDAPLFTSKEKTAVAVHKLSVPWFITVFFVCCLISTLMPLPKSSVTLIKFISNQFEVIALAAIGMRVKFKDLASEGPKMMTYGLVVGFFQVVTASLLIYFLWR